MKSKRLKLIKTLSTRIEAEIIKGFLKSNDIESEIISDDANQSYPSLSNVRGVNIFVEEDTYEKAQNILKEFEKNK